MDKETFMKTTDAPCFSLIEIGINGNAYLRNDAIKIVSFARQNVIPILGGDVYCKSKSGNKIRMTYDNWYCNREQNESLRDYVMRSCDVAEKFIINYKCKEEGDPIFDVSIASEWLNSKFTGTQMV